MRPHAHAQKQGRATPSERQSDTPTRQADGNKAEIKPTSDFLTRAEERADSDKKTRHEATHAATVPPRADERQERRRKDTADTLTSQKPPRAAADIRTPEDGKPKPSDGRRTPRGATLRHHAHAHTSRTAADMHTHESATRVVMPQFYIYIIIILLYVSLYSLCLYILQFFSSCCLFSLRFSACALCARVILPRLCIIIHYLCIFIYKVSIYRYFMQFLCIRDCLALITIYIMRDTLTP